MPSAWPLKLGDALARRPWNPADSSLCDEEEEEAAIWMEVELGGVSTVTVRLYALTGGVGRLSGIPRSAAIARIACDCNCGCDCGCGCM